jgi:hypothetical protein
MCLLVLCHLLPLAYFLRLLPFLGDRHLILITMFWAEKPLQFLVLCACIHAFSAAKGMRELALPPQ